MLPGKVRSKNGNPPVDEVSRGTDPQQQSNPHLQPLTKIEQSYRLESAGRKSFRILCAPTVTRPIIVSPQEPDYPKRRMEPTVDSFKIVRAERQPSRRKDNAGAIIVRRRSREYVRHPDYAPSTPLSRPYAPVPWPYADEVTPLTMSVAFKDKPAKGNLGKTPYRTPKESDRVGFVPAQLRYNLYYKGRKRLPRTESDWARDTRLYEDNRGIPFLRFTDLDFTDKDGSHDEGNGEFDGLVFDDAMVDTGFTPFGDPPIDRKALIGSQLTRLFQAKAKANRSYLSVPDRKKLRISKLLGAGNTRKQIAGQVGMSERSVNRTILVMLRELETAAKTAKP